MNNDIFCNDIAKFLMKAGWNFKSDECHTDFIARKASEAIALLDSMLDTEQSPSKELDGQKGGDLSMKERVKNAMRYPDVMYRFGKLMEDVLWQLENDACQFEEQAKQLTATQQALDSLKDAFSNAIGRLVTCEADNTAEWMLGLQDDINTWLELLGDSDRVEYIKSRRALKINKAALASIKE